MSTRITTSTLAQSTLANLQTNLSSMSVLQNELSSGSKINKPSDDPSGTVSALELQQQLRNNDQYSRNIADGQSWLATEDTALQTSVSQLNRAYDLATQANSASTGSADSRAAITTELEGIKQTLVSLANTQYNGRNVFAGTSGATAAVSVTSATDATTGNTTYGYSWATTGGTVDRRINANSTVQVDSNGAQVFGSDPPTGSPSTATSVFSALDNLISAVNSGSSTAMGTAMDDIQTHTTTISSELSRIGANETRLSDAADQTSSNKLDLQTSLSSVKDADIAETYVNLQMKQTAYQAALSATAKIIQPSLLDFLS